MEILKKALFHIFYHRIYIDPVLFFWVFISLAYPRGVPASFIVERREGIGEERKECNKPDWIFCVVGSRIPYFSMVFYKYFSMGLTVMVLYKTITNSHADFVETQPGLLFFHFTLLLVGCFSRISSGYPVCS